MGSKRILIVDNEDHIQNVLSRTFSAEGYDVSTASSGHEAMIKASKKQPSIVLLDYMMPIQDGLDVLEELKGKWRM